MTTQQPEALRLADYLDETKWQFPVAVLHEQAAAELRRLHELNEELLAREKRWSDIADVEVARCDKLQAINAQLLEALEDYAQYGMSQKARAAIAAAKGEA
jgi:hypothetical protein